MDRIDPQNLVDLGVVEAGNSPTSALRYQLRFGGDAGRDGEAVRPRRMGATNESIAFFAGRDGRAMRCVAFRDAARIESVLASAGAVDIAFTPQRNDFRGASDVEGLVRDIRPSAS